MQTLFQVQVPVMSAKTHASGVPTNGFFKFYDISQSRNQARFKRQFNDGARLTMMSESTLDFENPSRVLGLDIKTENVADQNANEQLGKAKDKIGNRFNLT